MSEQKKPQITYSIITKSGTYLSTQEFTSELRKLEDVIELIRQQQQKGNIHYGESLVSITLVRVEE